jgi:hypothetical protein
MDDKVLHLGLKILPFVKHSKTGHEIEVMPEYISMVKDKGFAWYNKTKYWESQPHGSKLASHRVELLKDQFKKGIETKLYLFENVPSEKCFEAKLLDYTENIEEIDFSAYPDKWDMSDKHDYLLKISEIKQVDRMKTLLKLTKYDDPEISIEDFLISFSGRNAKWLFTERLSETKEVTKQVEKSFVERINKQGPEFKKKIKNALKNMDETDRPGSRSKSRNEQGYLRAHIFSDKTEFQCSLCNLTRPTKIMVAGHIKARSSCSKEERLDPNIVMPICKVGCDELFEKGYILVDSFGNIVKNDKKQISNDLLKFLRQYENLQCTHFNQNTKGYFESKFISMTT